MSRYEKEGTVLTREEELQLQADYIDKHGVKPWVERFEKSDGGTRVRRLIVRGFGPVWWNQIKHWPNAHIPPCADCNGVECETSGKLCEKIWKWVDRI